MIAFIVVAVLVFVALAVLGGILISRANGPAAAPSNSPSQSAGAAGAFTSFVAPSSATCNGHGKHAQAPSVVVSWATTGAKQVWVARGSGDAAGSGEQVSLSGNQNSFRNPIAIDCTGGADVFTMTLVGNNGAHVSRTWSVTVNAGGPGPGKGPGGGGDGGDQNG